jgi:hypothetical protein
MTPRRVGDLKVHAQPATPCFPATSGRLGGCAQIHTPDDGYLFLITVFED